MSALFFALGIAIHPVFVYNIGNEIFEEAFMKKIIPFVSPAVFGLLGGLLIACGLGALAMMTSPFADLDKLDFLVLSLVVSALSALLILVMVIINMKYLINLENTCRAKLIIFAEAFVSMGLLFVSWYLWDPIVGELYHLF